MLIHNTEHTFYYIDPSLEAGGDGSSVATAANAFPAEMNTDNVIYLVRRTSIDTKANFPQLSSTKNWNTPKSVVFMGMPKSTDELFASMPEDAKTSWVDAEQDYAYVNEPTTGSYTFNFGNCANFHMSRICFMTNRTNDGWVIECYNGSYGTNVTIDHCWFRTALTDFTQESASKPDMHAGKQYLRFNNELERTSNFSKITNTRIDLYGNGDGIALAYTQNIYIDNCTFNLIQNESESRSAISWYWDAPKWGAELLATNLTAHYYYSNMRERLMASIIRGSVKRALVNTVTIDLGSVQNWSPYQNYYVSYSGCIALRTMGAGSVIENVTATIGSIGQHDRVIYLHYNQTEPAINYRIVSRGQYNVIRNVTINAVQDYNSNAYRYESTWKTTPWSYDGYGLVCCYIEGDRFRQAANDFLLQNIHVDAPMGCAIRADQAMVDLADCDVTGCVTMYNCVGKIKSIDTWYPGYAFQDRGTNTIYIGEVTCNKNNPRWEYNSQYSVAISFKSYLLVGSSNIRCYKNTYTDEFNTESYTYECNYICTNDQMEGAYFVRNIKSRAETWSVYRQGSQSNCSLRLTNETADDRYWPLKVGGVPFRGITQHVTAGDHTMTFYLTMYGYNDYSEIMNRFSAIIDLPTGERVFSQAGNWELDETSVWENLDGYTSYKLTIPFHMEEEGDISTSFQWFWYMVGAATFVDPFPTIA